MRTYSKRERLKIATGSDGDNAVSSDVDGGTVPKHIQNVEIEDRPTKKLRSAGVRCVSQPFFTDLH